MAGAHYVAGEDGRAQIFGMWVDPAARGSGVGRGLLEALLEWARIRGAARVTLWVFEDNDAAIHLYRSCGFHETGERQPSKRDPDAMEMLMARPIE